MPSKKCTREACAKRASFGARPGAPAMWCRAHAPEDAVDVKNKRCAHADCESLNPSFNTPGATRGVWCRAHAPEDAVDVVNKRCAHADCDARASYGLPGQAPTTCAQHRRPGTIAHPRRRCVAEGCKRPAILGATHAQFCERHGDAATQRNWIERPCGACGLPMVLGADGRCEACNPDGWRRARLAKQAEVQRWLDHHGLAYASCDRPVDRGACGLERPDFVFDHGTHVTVLEVDEHQHETYAEACECARMVNLHQSFGGLPVRFVRYNPDAYTVRGIRRAPSFHRRMRTLARAAAQPPPPDAPLSFCRLFFDGADATLFEPIATL